MIDFALHHYHGTSVIKEVVNDLYRGLSGAMYVKDTLTDPFPYAIGVYQGDPLSVAIFNTITCLLCDALSSMSMSTVGYQISSTKDTVDVLLFADDAVLISNSLKNSQRQCNTVGKISTMNWNTGQSCPMPVTGISQQTKIHVL